MKRIHRINLLVAGLFFIYCSCFAAQGSEPLTLKSFIENGKLKSLLSVSQGFDNNVNLDSKRREDGFTQVLYKPTFTSPLNDKLDAVLSYELLSMMYWDDGHDSNFLSNTVNFGLDRKINEDWSFWANHRFTYTDYIHCGKDDYFDNAVELKVKQTLPQKMFHSLGYEFLSKIYTERKNRNTAGTQISKHRNDIRNTVEYEIGKYLAKDLFKVKYQYFFNDSNEQYLHYYDYDSHKITASLTHILSSKWFLYTAFSRQQRYYRSRTLVVDNRFREREKTYVGLVGLYYNMKKDFTVGLNYTYRQNYSNEPIDNYSGSMLSINTYYNF